MHRSGLSDIGELPAFPLALARENLEENLEATEEKYGMAYALRPRSSTPLRTRSRMPSGFDKSTAKFVEAFCIDLAIFPSKSNFSEVRPVPCLMPCGAHLRRASVGSRHLGPSQDWSGGWS